jgi:ankyrin repeat protein
MFAEVFNNNKKSKGAIVMVFLILCIPLIAAILLGWIAFKLITPKNQRIFDWYAAGLFIALLPVAFYCRTLVTPHPPMNLEGWFFALLIFLVIVLCPVASYMLFHYRSFTVDQKTKRRTTRFVIFAFSAGILFVGLVSLGARTPTALAISQFPKLAKPLIHAGIGINTRSADWKSPLGIALDQNKLEIAKLLIAKGADVNAKHRDSGGKPATVYHPQEGVRTEILPDYTLLMVASGRGRLDAMELLVNSGADVNARTNQGQTALMQAAQWASTNSVTWLLDHGADIQREDVTGKTALAYAAMSISPKSTQAMLTKNTHFTQTDKDKALLANVRWYLSAQRANQTSTLSNTVILLKSGANINARNENGATPLMLAAEQNDSIDLVKTLIEHGADLNIKSIGGATALMYAMKSSTPHVTALLLQKSIDVDARDYNGRTALMWLIMQRLADSTKGKLLLEAGANINARDLQGMTPLMWAAKAGSASREKTNLLLDRGAKLNDRDIAEKTPLMYAVEGGASDIVLRMLQMGADPNALDKKNRSALSYAQEIFNKNKNWPDHKNTLDYLRQYEAK